MANASLNLIGIRTRIYKLKRSHLYIKSLIRRKNMKLSDRKYKQSVREKENLVEILKSLHPRTNPGSYVFTSVDKPGPQLLGSAVMTFKEKEGTTIILRREDAIRLQAAYAFESAWITLDVFSSLEAVGLTATISNLLCENNIPCNIVSARYHDHLFVPWEKRELTIILLKELANTYTN